MVYVSESERPIATVARESASRRSIRLADALLGLTVAFWLAAVIVPVALLIPWSFMRLERFQFVWSFGLDAYDQLVETGRYGVILTTLRIAAAVTLIDALIAIPFALWHAKGVRSYAFRAIMLAALTIPFFVSLTSRMIVFRPILGRNGAINTLLLQSGLIDRPLDGLLFSEFSVHLGLLGQSFPSMALPIFLAMSLIDDDLIEAGRDLGAAPAKLFLTVILPLSAPGIAAGVIFTTVPMLGETVVPQLLGGANVPMLGPSISSMVVNLNYPGAAAFSVVVLSLLAALFGVLRAATPQFASFESIFAGLRK